VKRGWNLNICSNFGKRCQNEAAISQTRMGKGQLVGVNDERARENDVKVKGTWQPEPLCTAVPSMMRFDVQQHPEHQLGRQGRSADHKGIQIVRLCRRARFDVRLGFPHGRNADNATARLCIELIYGALKMCQPVSEVGAEGNMVEDRFSRSGRICGGWSHAP